MFECSDVSWKDKNSPVCFICCPSLEDFSPAVAGTFAQ